jgi:hypothetical protein
VTFGGEHFGQVGMVGATGDEHRGQTQPLLLFLFSSVDMLCLFLSCCPLWRGAGGFNQKVDSRLWYSADHRLDGVPFTSVNRQW